MNVLSVGTIDKKKIQDADGYDKMIHSFDSLSYLKLAPNNFVSLKCQDYNNRIVSIDQECKAFNSEG